MSEQTENGTSSRKIFADITEETINYFKFISDIGWSGFECSSQNIETLNTWGKISQPVSGTLESIKTDLGNCCRCKLSENRTKIVFGKGSPNARLVFVGEGPGYHEDQQGEPFVGPSGQLLTKIIHAIKLTRESVYICNIVKCRPPGNRNPLPEEIKTCVPFLERQIRVIKPEFICALGAFAAQTLLNTNTPISRLRGRFHDYNGIKLMPTYHPSYLLKNPDKKRDVWEDMKKLMARYFKK